MIVTANLMIVNDNVLPSKFHWRRCNFNLYLGVDFKTKTGSIKETVVIEAY